MHLPQFFLLVAPLILPLVVSGQECTHRLVDVVTKHLVNDDAITFFDGARATLWLRKQESRSKKCIFSKYSHQADGSVREDDFYYDSDGVKNDYGTDIIKRSDKNGILVLFGENGRPKDYHGKIYVFHADHDVLGFYSCEIGESRWNMGIQVRTKEGLTGDTPMMKSLQQAKFTMDLILEEGRTEEYPAIQKMVQFDNKDLCFE